MLHNVLSGSLCGSLTHCRHIVAEIVQTEQDYVVALDMCINVCVLY